MNIRCRTEILVHFIHVILLNYSFTFRKTSSSHFYKIWHASRSSLCQIFIRRQSNWWNICFTFFQTYLRDKGCMIWGLFCWILYLLEKTLLHKTISIKFIFFKIYLQQSNTRPTQYFELLKLNPRAWFTGIAFNLKESPWNPLNMCFVTFQNLDAYPE